MYADDTIAAGPTADFLTIGEPIIPEVILPGKELVFVIELDLIRPVILPPDVLWAETPSEIAVGQSWSSYMASQFDSVETLEVGSIAVAPEGTPALRALFPVGSHYGFNDICEMIVNYPAERRESVTLRYSVYLDPTIDYMNVTLLGESQTRAFLTFPGLVGGQLWPGTNGHAYPVNDEPVEGDNWSARIRVATSGKIGPYLYVQNKPTSFGWLRLSDHALRINDLRGRWSVWEQTCTMNTPGVADGRCVLVIEGDIIVDVNDLIYRSAGFDDVVPNGMRMTAYVEGTTGSPISPVPATTTFSYWMKGFSIIESEGPSSGPPPAEGIIPAVGTINGATIVSGVGSTTAEPEVIVTGWVFPALGANVATSGAVAWGNPNNIITSNNTRAASASPSANTSQFLYASQFDFSSIPVGATILQVDVQVERRSNPAGVGTVRDVILQLTKDGTTLVGVNKAATTTDWPTGDQFLLYEFEGSETGNSTEAEVKATSFGVQLQIQRIAPTANLSAQVDCMQMRIHYRVPSNQGTGTILGRTTVDGIGFALGGSTVGAAQIVGTTTITAFGGSSGGTGSGFTTGFTAGFG